MRISRWKAALGLTLTGLAAGRAFGGNLLINPNFNTNLSSWGGNSATQSWNGRDAGGSAASGSALVTNADNGGGSQVIRQCVLLPVAASFAAGGKIFIPSSNAQGSTGAVLVDWYTDATCSGSSIDETSGFVSSTLGSDTWLPVNFPAVAPPAGAVSAEIDFGIAKNDRDGPTVSAYFDDVFFGPSSCAPDANTLCLHGGRFAVTAQYQAQSDPDLKAGTGVTLTDDTGYFWFFSPNNVEIVTKVLDACAFPGAPRFWVFAAGLTNVKVELKVVDTRSGQIWTRVNPQQTAFAPIQDTAAFDTCAAP